jgi:hypothetical protein
MKEKREMKNMILAVKRLGKSITEGGRVEVESFGSRFTLRVRSIKDIYYHKGIFYIIYETENPELYEKYSVQELPRLAIYVSMWTVEDLETGEKWIELVGQELREVKEYVRKLLDMKLEFEDYLYGFTPMFTVESIADIELYSAVITGASVVHNPSFRGEREITYKGKFLVIQCKEKKTGNVFYVLFKDLSKDLENLEKLKKGIV